MYSSLYFCSNISALLETGEKKMLIRFYLTVIKFYKKISHFILRKKKKKEYFWKCIQADFFLFYFLDRTFHYILLISSNIFDILLSFNYIKIKCISKTAAYLITCAILWKMYFDLRYTFLKTTVNTSSCILATNHPGLPKMLWSVDTHSYNSHPKTHFVWD